MTDNDDKNILERLIGGVREVVNTSEENQEKLREKVSNLQESEKSIDKRVSTNLPKGLVGLDIGTSRIVSMKSCDDGEIKHKDQLDAFVMMPKSPIALDMIRKENMKHYVTDTNIVVLGYDAQIFANIFNTEVRRPMEKGLLKSSEAAAIPALKEIISLVVQKPEKFGTNLTFGIPAPQLGFESDLIFHEAILKKYLEGMGFNARSITEGTAIVLSELAEDNYTGIGVSMGGGMSNVCFSFLSIPVIVFSQSKGGDNIDLYVSRISGETKNKVRQIKEEEFDFTRTPRNKMEHAFHIYYEELIMNLLSQLSAVLSQAENMPKIAHAIPIVLAGGTVMPTGFKGLFEKSLKKIDLPVQISEVKMAADPLRATARGALIHSGA